MSITYAPDGMAVIEHDGVTIQLVDDAVETGRLLEDRQHQLGYVEWRANGLTDRGERAVVYWLLIDDGETLPEDYDWSDVDRIAR
jgi:hypothetical protein